MSKQVIAMIQSYSRSAFVCLATLYVTNPSGSFDEIWKAFLIAFVAPILRSLDPNDKSFGIGSKE
jgi:hypothetical protein